MINETQFHDELAVFRAVTGGAYNLPNAYGGFARGSAFPRVGTIPLAVALPGTILSTGKAVRGSSTEFTKLIQGSYIYAGNVLRQIDYVVSDTLLFLKQAFPTDLSIATNLKVCERQYFKMIKTTNTDSANDAILQEAPIAPGTSVINGGAPLSYDATSGELQFEGHV